MRFRYWALVGVGFGLIYTALRQQWHSFMAGVLLVFAVLVTMAAVAAIYSMAEEGEYVDPEVRNRIRNAADSKAMQEARLGVPVVKRPEKREPSAPKAFSQPWRGPDKA